MCTKHSHCLYVSSTKWTEYEAICLQNTITSRIQRLHQEKIHCVKQQQFNKFLGYNLLYISKRFLLKLSQQRIFTLFELHICYN